MASRTRFPLHVLFLVAMIGCLPALGSERAARGPAGSGAGESRPVPDPAARPEADPEEAEALFDRGVARLATARYAEAVADLGRVCDLRPRWAEAHFQLGCALQELHAAGPEALPETLTRALGCFRRVLVFEPRRAEAWFKLGSVHDHLRHDDRALQAYDEALCIDPGYMKALFNAALIWRERWLRDRDPRSEERMRTLFTAANRADPSEFRTWLGLGVMRTETGDLTGALEAFDRGLALKADDVELQTNRARCLEQAGKPVLARDGFRTALTLDPENLEIRLTVAGLQHRTGQQGAAVTTIREGLVRCGSSLDDALRLVFSLAEMGQATEALRLVSDLETRHPPQASFPYLRGSVSMNLGDEDGAAPWFEKALALDPSYPQAHFALALCAQRRDDDATACLRYQCVASASPQLAANLLPRLLGFPAGTVNEPSLLHRAIQERSPFGLRFLLAAGLPVNIADASGSFPLHRAVETLNLSFVQLLLGHGADRSVRDAAGRTPLQLLDDLHTPSFQSRLLHTLGLSREVRSPRLEIPVIRNLLRRSGP